RRSSRWHMKRGHSAVWGKGGTWAFLHGRRRSPMKELPITIDVSSRDHHGGTSTERGIPLPYYRLVLCRVDLGQDLLDGDRRVRRADRAQHLESVLGKRQLGVHD